MDTPGKLSIVRFALRLVLAGTLGLFLALAPATWCAWAVAAASPHVSICSAVALRSLGLLAAVCLPAIAAAMLSRRVFCRFCCPVGLLTDLCRKLRPGPKPPIGKLPRFGQWLALVSLGGAILGCPLFLWLDPMAIFSGAAGAFHVPAADLRLIGLVPASILAGVLLISFIVPNLWCGRLCPLGGTQEALADLGRLLRRRKADSPAASATALPLARRTVLCAGAGAAWVLAIPSLFQGGQSPLRPPGARDEMAFKAACIRCGNCVRVCPTGIIKRDMNGQASGFLAPVIRFSDELYPTDYCLPDCNKCTQACPTGAIERMGLAEKNIRPIGLIRVDADRCYLAIPEDCEVCVPVCPPRAIEAKFSYETGSVLEIDPALCNGCGMCRTVCPASCLVVELS